MNKKIKSLVMAGLVSIMAGSAVVSSNALCKDNVTTTSKKGAIYIFVNGKKHVINLGGINNHLKIIIKIIQIQEITIIKIIIIQTQEITIKIIIIQI